MSQVQPKSFFSPWSSPLDHNMDSSYSSPCPGSSQLTRHQDFQNSQDSAAYSDDLEMTDCGLLNPGPFHTDPGTTISSRIPTPIHSQFSRNIRSMNRVVTNFNHAWNSSDHASHSGMPTDHVRDERRLPSPISEGAGSPGSLIQGLNGVQMDIEQPLEEIKSPVKKGHARSRHSTRSWGPFESDDGSNGVKKGFSMGYKADCDKCRMKMPGHFSHIVTY